MSQRVSAASLALGNQLHALRVLCGPCNAVKGARF